MGSELWEIVRADELVPDDVYTCDSRLDPIRIHNLHHARGIWRGGGIVTLHLSGENRVSLAEHQLVFRRVDPADDPRVLRRALEIACTDKDDDLFHEYCVELARRELESEVRDGEQTKAAASVGNRHGQG